MSIAVVLDSNSGVTKEEAKELGLFVRPMPFMVDGNVYYEGVDLSHEETGGRFGHFHLTALAGGCDGDLGRAFEGI